MHSDPNHAERRRRTGCRSSWRSLSAATVLSVGISLDHRDARRRVCRQRPRAFGRNAGDGARLRESHGSDPSLPAAADSLRGNGGAAGDDATTF